MSPDDYEGRHEADSPHDAEPVVDDAAPGTPPGITPHARSVIYFICFGVEIATLVVCGFLVIFGLMSVEQAAQISALVFIALGLTNSSLSVGYRPTRPGAIS